ncbi:MAG: hypothetical protein GY950_10175, partial [bacterium]|nr:hypothetical protein [bacterium]
KKLHSINPEYKKIKFTDRHKEEIWDFFKTNPVTRKAYEQIKKNLEFPDYFQAVRNFVAADQKLYVQTFKRKDGKTEFFIFDDNGKFLKTAWLPIRVHVAVDEKQLFTIHGGKLYQLIENEDEEEFELHIDEIK